MPAINNVLGQGVSFVRNIHLTKPIDFKGLRYAPELADSVTLSTRKLSPGDLDKWDAAVSGIFRNNYRGLGTTKNMNETDRIELLNALPFYDKEAFLLVSTGARPAMATDMNPILNKINSPEYYVLPDKLNDCRSAFIFNKEAMLENIDRNKEFYTKRLNITPETSNQEIYQVLTGSESPLSTVERVDCNDIIGVMFGYPVKNSIIFQLGRDMPFGPELRKNIPKYKAELKKALNAEDCKYASFGDKFKQDMEKTIDSIESINTSPKVGYPHGYQFIKFADEPLEEGMIGKRVRNATAELDRINKIEEERRFAKELDELENMSGSQKQYFDFLRDLAEKYGM